MNSLKNNLFAALMMLLSGWCLAQPANDNCAAAIDLMVGTTFQPEAYSNIASTSEVVEVAPNPTCGGYSGGDVWFTFTVPASGDFQISLTGQSDRWVLYTGNCGSFDEVDCGIGTRNFSNPDLAGETYYLRIFRWITASGGNFQLSVWEPPVPENNLCANATDLTVGNTLDYASYSNFYATNDGLTTAPNPSCGIYSGGDVWFTFTAPVSGKFQISLDGQTNYWVLYAGECGNFEQIHCDNGTENFSDPEMGGETYYLRIFRWNAALGGNFEIAVWETPVPENDLCANAIDLTVGNTLAYEPFSNLYATNDGVATAPNPSCGIYSGGDVWFTFTAPASGDFQISLDGQTNYWVLYAGECGNFEQVHCDNGTENFSDPEMGGETYYLRVFRWNAALGGNFDIAVWETPVPENDVCANAIDLTVGNALEYVAHSNLYATNDGVGTAPNPTCGSYSGGDVWFAFTVPASGNFQISLTGQSNQWALYAGECGSFEQIRCDNGTENFSDPEMAGEMFYLRVFRFNTHLGGNFEISVWEIPVPENDLCANAIDLTVGNALEYMSYSNLYATNEGVGTAPNPTCGLYSGGDVWFTFTAPESGDFQISLDGQSNQWALYSGECGNFEQVHCDVGTYNFSDPEMAAETFYIRVYRFNSALGGSIEISIWESVVPENDLCANAIDLTVGNVLEYASYSNMNATNDGVGIAPNPTCGLYSGGDVWFTFTAPESGDFQITLTGQSNQWALYSGACGNFEQVHCDAGTENFSNPEMAEEIFYLRVFRFNSELGGSFDISVWENAVPDNDLCADAIEIAVTEEQNYQPFSTVNSTGDGLETGPDPSCGLYSGGDVWFTFTSPESGNFQISIPGSSNYWTIYSGTCGNLEEVHCGSATIDFNDPELGGQAYYLRVYRFNNALGADFEIAISEIIESDLFTITDLPTTAQEGDTIWFEITTTLSSGEALMVNLESSHPAKFMVPATVEIPAGSQSVLVMGVVPENDNPEGDINVQVSITAVYHEDEVATILINNDDDFLSISIALNTDTIAENAGNNAATATLTRSGSPSGTLKVVLSTDMANALNLPSQITFANQQSAKTFAIGAMNNNMVDGFKSVEITAAVYYNACACSAPSSSPGNVSATLVISDDDSPAIFLTATPGVVAEGLFPAGVLTVSLNTTLSEDITVQLSSSDEGEVTLPAQVVIPAGATSANVDFNTLNDGIEDASQQSFISAVADDFASGLTVIVVSDINKPDMQLVAVNLEESAVGISDTVHFTLDVYNGGFSTAPIGYPIRCYFSTNQSQDGSDLLVYEGLVQQAVPMGDTVTVSGSFASPFAEGIHYLIFQINATQTFTELTYNNNFSQPEPIEIIVPYYATVWPENETYQRGDTVPLFGNATLLNGDAASMSDVEVYLLKNSTRREVWATTDGSGDFATQYVPFPSEAGHYQIGASYPGVNSTVVQSSFDILGVKINGNSQAQWQFELGDTLNGTLQIQNLNSIAYHQFTLSPISLPSGAFIVFDTLDVLGSYQTQALSFSLWGESISPNNSNQLMTFEVQADEDIVQTFNAFYTCIPANGYLASDMNQISTTVSTTAGTKQVEFLFYNTGLGETGEISISLPDVSWMTALTPLTLPSMQSGDSASVIIEFIAAEELIVNAPYSGNFVVSGETCFNNLNIPFTLQKVTETTGSLVVDVVNQFTYFDEDEPHVAGANVVIKNPYTQEIYAQGLTDENGLITFDELPEGNLRIVVTKQQHFSYASYINIDPGAENNRLVFLEFQSVIYSWNVVPTTIADEYEINLVFEFETHVNVPVVVLDMPNEMPALTGDEEFNFYATITNHGLIGVTNVQISLPTNDVYEFITDYEPTSLGALSSLEIPVTFRLIDPEITESSIVNNINYDEVSNFLGIPTLASGSGSGGCGGSVTNFTYQYECASNILGGFGASATHVPGGGGGNCGSVNPGGIPGGNGGVTPGGTTQSTSSGSCIGCVSEVFSVLGDCFPGLPGLIGQGISLAINANCMSNATTIQQFGACIPIPIPGPLKCPVSAVKLGVCGYNLAGTGSPGGIGLTNLNNDSEDSPGIVTYSSAALSSTGYPEYIEIIFDDIAAVVPAIDSLEVWSYMYYGELADNEAFYDFSALVEVYIQNKELISLTNQEYILNYLSTYDIPTFDITTFFDHWNTSVEAYNNGVMSPNDDYPTIIDWSAIDGFAEVLAEGTAYAIDRGFDNIFHMLEVHLNTLMDPQGSQTNPQALCVSVTIGITQQATMTREAFDGTLSIFNGHATDNIDSLALNLEIYDPFGNLANELFEITFIDYDVIDNAEGEGVIPPGETGSVVVRFIPTNDAAPIDPVQYSFGGSITYFDPFNDAMTTMDLSPNVHTVHPSPSLFFHYFMQRNIISDDPLTDEVEPTVPADFAVMINNSGNGTAQNVMVHSAQPEILENDQGLAIEFSLLGSSLQGQPATLGLIDINFGTILPQSAKVGEWLFASTLLGKFLNYEAELVYSGVSSNPDISLVEGVELHELSKSIRLYGNEEDNINDFLVNDNFDAFDRPDAIYRSQGDTVYDVFTALGGEFTGEIVSPTFTNTLTVVPSLAGWNFIRTDDPGEGNYTIVSITREDGQEIPLSNAWLTFVTLPANFPPVYEDKFHFVDKFLSDEAISYTIVWAPAEGYVAPYCPELMANIGDACDDGNADTENDVVGEDCICAGEEPEVTELLGSANWSITCGEREIAMKFYEPGTAILVSSLTTIIDQNGNFTLSEVPIGTYDIYAKIEGQLAKAYYNQTIALGSNSLSLGTFTNGDLNNDNAISLNDVSNLNISFGTSDGDANYNYLADINCDGTITLADFSILNIGYGLVGAQP